MREENDEKKQNTMLDRLQAGMQGRFLASSARRSSTSPFVMGGGGGVNSFFFNLLGTVNLSKLGLLPAESVYVNIK